MPPQHREGGVAGDLESAGSELGHESLGCLGTQQVYTNRAPRNAHLLQQFLPAEIGGIQLCLGRGQCLENGVGFGMRLIVETRLGDRGLLLLQLRLELVDALGQAIELALILVG